MTTSIVSSFFYVFLIGYLIGSIPSGYIAGKIFKGIDIREHGSGNIGTTNVFRILGWKFGVVVFFADFLKALIFIQIVKWHFFSNQSFLLILAALMVIVGNVFPIFLKFKGGKGVASAAGLFVGLCPVAFLIAFVVFGLVVAKTRYVSLGSLLASLSLFLANLFFYFKGDVDLLAILVLTGLIVIFIWLKHTSNIKRLIKGTELKIGEKEEK